MEISDGAWSALLERVAQLEAEIQQLRGGVIYGAPREASWAPPQSQGLVMAVAAQPPIQSQPAELFWNPQL